jgi:hypothetical protein
MVNRYLNFWQYPIKFTETSQKSSILIKVNSILEKQKIIPIIQIIMMNFFYCCRSQEPIIIHQTNSPKNCVVPATPIVPRGAKTISPSKTMPSILVGTKLSNASPTPKNATLVQTTPISPKVSSSSIVKEISSPVVNSISITPISNCPTAIPSPAPNLLPVSVSASSPKPVPPPSDKPQSTQTEEGNISSLAVSSNTTTDASSVASQKTANLGVAGQALRTPPPLTQPNVQPVSKIFMCFSYCEKRGNEVLT